MRWSEFLRPHTSIPVTPWTASTRWDLSLKRTIILVFGLSLFGIGETLLVISGLGNTPWMVLAQGISLQTSLSIGLSTFLVSTVVLSLWIPLRERPGFGTLANIVVIASVIDIAINLIPHQHQIALRLLYVFLGIALVGLGSGFYITCGLGPGPRDGWMTALHRRTGKPIWQVRLSIELIVLTCGALLGGTVGVGTALFALLIGQSVALAFGVVARITQR